MIFLRRSLVALGVAAMLPTIIFAAVALFYFLRTERLRVEDQTLARSEMVMNLVDARLQRDIAALNVLTSTIYFDNRNWAEFYTRVQRVLAANQGWATVALLDVGRNATIFDLRRPFGSPTPPEREHPGAFPPDTPLISDIWGEPEPLIWVYLPVQREGVVRFALCAAIHPHVFQEILLGIAQRDATSAIVDRKGRFIARTKNYENLLGKYSTQYVRRAIADGPNGFYPGTTWEGLKNYTAYHTTAWSGWSAHLAVDSTLIDAPRMWSLIVAGLAALGGVALGGVLIILILRDMAERRRAEDALRQSQKMEAVGQLTGGIAHDFNNLLTAVIGNLDLLRTRAAGDERLQRLATNALEAAQRGAKLASQLLAFSREQRMALERIDLETVLHRMGGLLRQSVGPGIEVRVQISPAARFVVSDVNQLELALLNIAVNARDAMPGGGLLTLVAQLDARAPRGLPRGSYVALCASDTGVGMTEEVRARAMEPFYTTKALGLGTGLGLAQVYAVARESGGALSIESTPGQGTTIRLTLPLAYGADAPTTSAQTFANAPALINGADRRVLVVDDDPLVRRFIVDSLRSFGYEVTEVDDGAKALRQLEKTGFDLLLVDFAMPGMNGADVAAAARRLHPGIPILIVSGYADSAALEAAAGSVKQLRKPFDVNELQAAVDEVID